MQALLERYPDHCLAFLNVAQGGLYEQPTMAHTVLGSCVSVTFFVPSRGLSAIFPALLPRAAEYRLHDHTTPTPYKFVDTAIENICARLSRRGASRQEIECKVFGGASALFNEEMSVGRRNVEVAFATLAELGLRVAVSNIGGERGRKIYFASGAGEIFVRMFQNGSKPQPSRRNAR